jgi:cyclopropane-fatty-acyl-phospholipid synthase
MKSKIAIGHVVHHRLKPVKHFFKYPAYFYVFDLDELPALNQRFSFFGHNQKKLVSLWDKDYLKEGKESLKEKVFNTLKSQGMATAPARIELVTTARFMGYVFNPISFFYCYDAGQNLMAVIAQVNNTFHESHVYVLAGDGATAQKEFYVSPFFKVAGNYQFKFSKLNERADIHIHLLQNNELMITTQLTGVLEPLSKLKWLTTLTRYPFLVFLTLPRITWHAFLLHFIKKLPVVSKTGPLSANTLRKAPPKFYEKMAQSLIERFAKNLPYGQLVLDLPSGQSLMLGKTDPKINIQINGYRAFWHTLLHTDIGFAESYMRGDIEIPDLTGALKNLARSAQLLRSHRSVLASFGQKLNHRFHLSRKNHLGKATENIQEHYDLGNEFFKLFLDETLMYSSAIFKEASQNLHQAQLNKIEKLLNKLELKPEHHLLEIGSGWGAVALAAAQKYGCRVTTITLSQKQKEYVQELVRSQNLQHLIEVKLIDYRRLEGQFDRIVSVEMLEAVGHEYLGAYFETCQKLLKKDGRLVLQVITIEHSRYYEYLNRCDFIQKHIFPGGHLPSLQILEKVITQNSNLKIIDQESIGLDYAKTLALWREKFISEKEKIILMGFDEMFYRKWLYYFSYCEAGFETKMIDDYQLVLRERA